MTDHSTAFFILTILALATILLIFAMKYFAAGRIARLQASCTMAMESDLAEVKSRLSAIEKLLRDVE